MYNILKYLKTVLLVAILICFIMIPFLIFGPLSRETYGLLFLLPLALSMLLFFICYIITLVQHYHRKLDTTLLVMENKTAKLGLITNAIIAFGSILFNSYLQNQPFRDPLETILTYIAYFVVILSIINAFYYLFSAIRNSFKNS
jgi:uncharacterized membrane protein